MSIVQLMFFQSVMCQTLYFVSFLHVWEKVEEIGIGFPFGHVLLITQTSQTIRNRILNIDQLEMKYMLVSGGSIL